MVKVNFKIEGASELDKLLKKAQREAPRAAEKIIHNYAEKGKKIAKENAPVDTSYMKDHIASRPFNMGAYIESPAKYSSYVNFGTRYQSSQPFFSDMWEEITEDIQKPLQEAIEGVLK